MTLNKIIIILLFSFLSLFSSTFAQERIYVDKKEFRQTTDGFDDAWKNVNKGDFLFYQHREGSYRNAIAHYKKALEYNSENAELNLLIGICYLRSWPKELAAKHIEKACDLKPKVHPKAQFLLGRAYQSASDFNKAIIAYNSFKDDLSASDLKEYGDKIFKYIEECENGLILKKNPVRAIVDKIDTVVNSYYDDYNPVLSSDGKTMLFTSCMGLEGDLTNPLDDNFYEDIYSSEKQGKNWSPSLNIESPVNTKWNDAAVALSADGKLMVIYRGHSDGGDLYVATFEGKKWGNIHDLTNKLNKEDSQESSACLNADGTKMYFVSNKTKDSYGGRDIYMSTLDKKGKKWSKAVNLGSVINTQYEELSVFITPDEKTLYFSSNGHKSIGGFDIFKSEKKDSGWSEPVNLGMPINSPVDEIYFKLMSNGRDAYYCSDRDGGQGGLDIYHITILGAEKPLALSNEDDLIAGIVFPDNDPLVEDVVQIKYTRMTVVKGTVSDFNTNKPIVATVELVDNSTGKLIKDTKSDPSTGNYLISLPSGSNYGFSVNADGYMFHSENFVVPAASGYKEIFKDIALQPMTAGSKIILYNTFFETGKSNLRVESYSELNRLALMFTKYPKLILEISGHTDNRGSVAANKKLSKARADAVKNYLLGQGVSPTNLQSVGYDFKYPVANNKTAEGRQQNRRVEAKIISN